MSEALIIENLRVALADVDTARENCPVGKPRSGHIPTCPKCGATPSQNCGPDVGAMYRLTQAVRGMVAPPQTQTKAEGVDG